MCIYGEIESELAPTHVVLYDAEPALVRAVEVRMKHYVSPSVRSDIGRCSSQRQ